MQPAISTLASGLKLFMFQGVASIQGKVLVATLDGDLLWVGMDGAITPWTNVMAFGVPKGLVALQDKVGVVISGQESGHALLEVTPDGKVSQRVDLSDLVSDFGTLFDLTVHRGDRPYYLVTLTTDVIRTGGMVVRVTPAGKVNVVSHLPSTPFCIDTCQSQILIAQDDGQLITLLPSGRLQPIVNLKIASLGTPFGITHRQQEWLITTTDGWLVSLKPDRTVEPLINISKAGLGAPTTLTWCDRTNDLVVATGEGNLLKIDL